MKKLRTLFAAALSALFLLVGAAPHSSFAERARGSAFELSPRLSEGVTLAPAEEGSMSILAHESGNRIVFDETKTLSFTVSYDEGWLPCSRYSRFFPNDSNAAVTDQGGGVYLYTYSARKSYGVALAEWTGVHIYASVSELPKLYIDAEADFEDIGKEAWVGAQFTLIQGTKQFPGGDYEGSGEIKGRGNSSWTYPKKPYSIKLGSKASLLGIPKTKKYAVIPGYHDTTLMRDYITYKIWQGLEGIDYVPKCEFVDVYLNGVYNGVYTLVERIDIEKNKIDIEEADADNMTGGYLIEKDIRMKMDMDSDLWFDCPYWANISQDFFVLKSPEPDDPALADAMRSYLTDYMQRVHDSIMGVSGEDWHNYVDISSWIDFIIVQEIAKNIDGNMKTSCWLYKDREDDHIYMTAPWDFDLAYGRVNWNNQSEEHNDVIDCPGSGTHDGFMILNSSNPWMDRLWDTEPEFRQALMRRYTAYRSTLIEDMFTMIEEQAAYLDVVQVPNNELWGMNFHNGVNALKNWLTQRIAWLDGEWLTEETFAPGDVNMDGAVDSSDALLVLRCSLGLAELDPEALAIADVNGDGEVSASDALLILRLALGLEERK